MISIIGPGPGPGPSAPCGGSEGPTATATFDPGPVLIAGPHKAAGPEGDDDEA